MTFATFSRMNMFLNMITFENISNVLINYKNLVKIILCCLILRVYNTSVLTKEHEEDEEYRIMRQHILNSRNREFFFIATRKRHVEPRRSERIANQVINSIPPRRSERIANQNK